MNDKLHDLTERVMTRELSYRSHDGLEVTLLWRPSDDYLMVAVADAASGTGFEIPVGDRPPLEVFHHPYAYAPLTAAA